MLSLLCEVADKVPDRGEIALIALAFGMLAFLVSFSVRLGIVLTVPASVVYWLVMAGYFLQDDPFTCAVEAELGCGYIATVVVAGALPLAAALLGSIAGHVQRSSKHRDSAVPV